ncbi:MATE family efflux transporter [Ketobacter alkanivorans]|uniref:MATE family efflux transporter n=1 Tax=Ketobacter alkanivorans TaxID=1917421 RepID=A0A2K9LJ45_9GAMM|nr:MATE family efflux transporter [Ketobacter alkanivorans]AUM12201.1 hypothetical protein Kalk_07165 [Ketobacter alkanivorans]
MNKHPSRSPGHAPSYLHILQLTWPIILANSATPLLGLADTAIIGHTASPQHLGAIALGALLFNFVYWGFGFLRMSTTGFVAQAAGRDDNQAIVETTLRALLMGVLIGLGLMLLQWPLLHTALTLFGASDTVEYIAAHYFSIRIWGAPATLGTYALMGYLIGRGLSRTLLVVQLILNGLNITLDYLFAGYWDMGARGIALGTALSEWITFVIALLLVYRHQLSAARTHLNLRWRQLVVREKLIPVLKANGNLMIRTLFLLLGFAVFTDQSARFGDITLAANHILLQFISFSAFFLDGFAFASESLAGRALGKGQRESFLITIKRSTLLAAATALLLAAFILAFGDSLLALLTDLPDVQRAASSYLAWCALYVAVSFAAFQLDGLFIGTTTTAALRNASVLSTCSFLLLCYWLTAHYGNTGLWAAFIGFILLRAVFLGAAFGSITRRLDQTHP